METLEAIFNRRSIRDFKEVPVTDAEIETLLKAAFSAPTAVNTQPWEFVVINEKERLDIIRDKMIFARYNAPLGIVVCGNMKFALKSKDKDLWICDCSAAIENMLLAATDIGLASVWIGIYPIESRMATMQHLINCPEHVKPLSMVYFGHGTYQEPGRCRYNEKAVYWQTYDPDRKHRTKDKPVMGHY
ncbi:MAG: nitroreductase [Firmicutes bacterium]|nr:nitroreductase [Bacillota bacterium]